MSLCLLRPQYLDLKLVFYINRLIYLTKREIRETMSINLRILSMFFTKKIDAY